MSTQKSITVYRKFDIDKQEFVYPVVQTMNSTGLIPGVVLSEENAQGFAKAESVDFIMVEEPVE